MPEKYISGFCETLDWRPVRFVDLSPTQSCSLCSVVPGKTYVLQCSHAVCELCYDGLLKSGRRCPLDKECFDESCVEKCSITQRQVETQIVFCMNSKKGCTFVGKVEEMKHHFLRECNFHAITCRLCNAKVLRREIVNHYTQGRCQHGISFPDADYSNADLMESQTKTYGSVRKYGEKMEQQLNDHQELLKRILETQERLETTSSKAGNEFHDKVEEQTRYIGEAVNKSLEISLENVSTNLSRVLQKQDCAAADLRDVPRQLHSHHEEQTKVDHEVMKGDMILERQVEDTNKYFPAVIEKLMDFSSEMGSTKHCVASNSKDVSRCLQSVTESIADVSCKLTRLDTRVENLQIIARDLDVLLQHSEEGMKFINVDAEAKEKKPIAMAIFDISQKMKSVEEAMSSLHLVWLPQPNEVFQHIKGFSEFRKEGNEKHSVRSSDVFLFCGYSVKLSVEIKPFDGIPYLGLYFCICQSPNDSLLKWPFFIPYTLMLVHPTNKKNNIKHSITDFSNPYKHEINIFFKPTTAMNAGWGAYKLCKVQDMDVGGFIVNDSICVGIKVSSSP